MDEIKTRKELDEEVLSFHGTIQHFMFDCQACPELTKEEKKKIKDLVDGNDSIIMRLGGIWAITNPDK